MISFFDAVRTTSRTFATASSIIFFSFRYCCIDIFVISINETNEVYTPLTLKRLEKFSLLQFCYKFIFIDISIRHFKCNNYSFCVDCFLQKNNMSGYNLFSAFKYATTISSCFNITMSIIDNSKLKEKILDATLLVDLLTTKRL